MHAYTTHSSRVLERRLHTVDDVTHTERTCVGLSTGEVPIGSSAPSISLLVDVKPRAALSAATWKLQVSSNVELEIGEANLNPSRHLSGKYAPNADFRLLRAVLTAQQARRPSPHDRMPQQCTTSAAVSKPRMLHLTCGLPAAGSRSCQSDHWQPEPDSFIRSVAAPFCPCDLEGLISGRAVSFISSLSLQ
eukprot:6214476-Pleurochrysis_carterae.AAC.7